jgi:hypothetical protein
MYALTSALDVCKPPSLLCTTYQDHAGYWKTFTSLGFSLLTSAKAEHCYSSARQPEIPTTRIQILLNCYDQELKQKILHPKDKATEGHIFPGLGHTDEGLEQLPVLSGYYS